MDTGTPTCVTVEHNFLNEATRYRFGGTEYGLNTPGLLFDRLTVLVLKAKHGKDTDDECAGILRALASCAQGVSSDSPKVAKDRATVAVASSFSFAVFDLLAVNALLWELHEPYYNGDGFTGLVEHIANDFEQIVGLNLVRTVYIKRVDELFWRD